VIDGVFTSLIFNKTARRLIYCLKYKPYLADLTSLLAEFFFEGLIQQETFVQTDKTDAFLVPIPLHAKRLRMRGYNQAKYLADALGKHLALPVREVLVRVRFTRSQTTLKRNERRENMRNAFALKHDALLAKNIFLVDDVFTSGATFAEAAYILKRRGVKRVYGLALAHG
jgi:ComF family protein